MPITYKLSGRVVSRDEFIAHETHANIDYENGNMPAVRMGTTSWQNENGGKGRYISQMADKPNDPKAYFRSRSDVEEACRRRGLTYERA